ncbi:MAG TPA: TatD family hydrolase [Acidimicrobiales bacterium]|jgi:TatD DNase family protein|nr:TatD family hydrolase [Acidimicrobiales bacterium]
MTDAVVEWFDSHCHLQAEFADDGEETHGPHATRLAATVARAAEAGVTRMVCVGTGAGSSDEALSLARSMRHPDSVAVAEGVEVWSTIGLHPHDAVDGTAEIERLLEAEVGGGAGPDGAPPLVVAVGECGLDYHYDHSPRPRQREVFARQVELAHRHGLALVVHSREAWEDTIGILAGTGVPERTILHCFTGGPAEARRCLDLGASLSFSGVVTFKNAAEVREAAVLCPFDRLLVETDTPFLAPVPHRGTLNEPSRVPLIGAAIAQVKGVNTALVAAASTANARAAFRV